MKPSSPPVTASLGFGMNIKTVKPQKEDDNSLPVQNRHARIVVVDNDAELCRLLAGRLAAANYKVESVSSAQAAIEACARFRPHLVITALRMEEMDGLGLLKVLTARWPNLSVIILTAHGTIPEAVQATQCGAFGFLVKPIEKAELLGQVRRAIAASTFTQVPAQWRANIVSRSQLMEDRLGQADRAARCAAPVLLNGESGTGKELFARAIHAAGIRRGKPFIVVTCRTAVEDDLEAEIFGTIARTSSESTSPNAGALQAAEGGTLLLAEIANLPLRLQIKLAEALREDHELSGSLRESARADVRLICTTSRDLLPLINSGHFNDDLYYRINVLPIEVPPLGRRREDIPLLISCFLERATEESGPVKLYSPEAIHLLVTADWPGNVRQLFDLVKQNVAQSEGGVMTKEFVQQSLGGGSTSMPSYEDARDEFARDYLTKNLLSAHGNVTEAARLAKRNRTDFYKLLLRHRIQVEEIQKQRS
jgi:two-component system response regulator GlrR